VTHLTVPAVPASISRSNFVCDSLHLAKQLGTNHYDLLKSLRRAQDASATEGSRCQLASRTYIDKRGKERPIFDLTLENLIDVSMYLEKLRPKFRKYIKTITAKLQAALVAKDPFYLETNDYGTKVVRKIPEDKQTGLIFNEEGELCRALLREMDSEQRFFAWAGLDEDRAHGILRAHVRKKDWLVQARQKIAKGLEPAPMTAFGLKSQGEASFVRLLRDELTRE